MGMWLGAAVGGSGRKELVGAAGAMRLPLPPQSPHLLSPPLHPPPTHTLTAKLLDKVDKATQLIEKEAMVHKVVLGAA